jgi:HEAT repeat protein
MQRNTRLIVGSLLLATGCAAGPFEELAWMNPIHRQEWAKDDHDANNYHNRIKEYRTIATTIGQMSQERQDVLAQDLALEFDHETDPLYRIEIVRAMGPARSPAAEGGLKKAIKDGNTDVRIAACVAWRKRGGEAAAKALQETVIGDSERTVRLAAAKALGDLKDPSSLRNLGLALEQGDPAMQYACIESMKKISGKDYGSNLSAWQEFAEGGEPVEEPATIAKGLQSLLR